MMLADTNLIIYATRPDYAVVSNWLVQTVPACSVITRVEALGYRRLNANQNKQIAIQRMGILNPLCNEYTPNFPDE